VRERECKRESGRERERERERKGTRPDFRERARSFAEYSLFPRALLQKRPIFLGSLPIVAILITFSKVDGLYNWVHTSQWRNDFLRHGFLEIELDQFYFERQMHVLKSRWAMGWLRLVGSLKLQVSLENIGLFCRALLQ